MRYALRAARAVADDETAPDDDVALLVVHGMFGGHDQGLACLGGHLPQRRAIVPSRFGYLGSALPPGASVADQADGYAELLDALGVARADVLAFSSGATSASWFALRHPDRVRQLVLVSGLFPGEATRVPPAGARRLGGSDTAMWVVKALLRPVLIRLVGGPGIRRAPLPVRRAIDAVVDCVAPGIPRAPGVLFDAYVSNPAIDDVPFEAIRVPTAIVHASRDLVASTRAARRVAARNPDARQSFVDRGGHLLVAQERAVAAILRDVLG